MAVTAGYRGTAVPRCADRNLRFWARVIGLPAGQIDDMVDEAMTAVALTDIASQRGGTLSRGQTQRWAGPAAVGSASFFAAAAGISAVTGIASVMAVARRFRLDAVLES